MDDLTSRCLGWLISSCETPKAVDVALQSLAGADYSLPCGPLWECDIPALIVQRVRDSFASQQLPITEVDQLARSNASQHQPVVLYAHSLNFIFSQMGRSGNKSEHVCGAVEPLRSFYER